MSAVSMRKPLVNFLLWIRHLLRDSIVAQGPTTEVSGLRVIDAINAGYTEALVEKLRAATTLLQQYDEIALAKARRALSTVVFFPTGPEFWPRTYACVLPDVRHLSAPQVAILLIHEATHARLWRCGFRYDPAERSRIERICVRAELSVLRRIPWPRRCHAHDRDRLLGALPCI